MGEGDSTSVILEVYRPEGLGGDNVESKQTQQRDEVHGHRFSTVLRHTSAAGRRGPRTSRSTASATRRRLLTRQRLYENRGAELLCHPIEVWII